MQPAKSAFRAMELLEFFAECRREASVSEISQSLGYPQSSTSVLLNALANAGYFDRNRLTGHFAPSIRLLLAVEWIGDQFFNERSLLRLMEGVLAETGYTVVIGTQQGIHARYLHALQSTREGRYVMKSGALRPLFRSATGKMLLTMKTEREISLLLRQANALEKDPANRIELASVLKELQTARTEGYAQSLGTAQKGMAALAILLPVPKGQKQLTLTLGGPIHEIEQQKQQLICVLQRAVEPLWRATVR